jgi:hypothetical protein
MNDAEVRTENALQDRVVVRKGDGRFDSFPSPPTRRQETEGSPTGSDLNEVTQWLAGVAPAATKSCMRIAAETSWIG